MPVDPLPPQAEGFANQRLIRIRGKILQRSTHLALTRSLYLTDIGHYPAAANHLVERPEGCPEHIIHFIASGSGWIKLNGQTWELNPGSVFVIPANTPHSYGSNQNDPWGIYWIHFSGSDSALYLEHLGATLELPIVHLKQLPELISTFETTYRWIDYGYSDRGLIAISSHLRSMLSLIVAYQQSPRRKSRGAEHRILEVITFMREHATGSHDLGKLAESAGLSIPHFSALFRKQTGTSPIHFLARLRMQRACELLDSTKDPIATISRAVGYENPLYFCRLFRQHVGMAPSQYRKHERSAIRLTEAAATS